MTTKEMKRVKLDDDKSLSEMLDSFQFKSYNVGRYVIIINTGIAFWRVCHNGDKVTSLWHENHGYNIFSRNPKTHNAGFHKEDLDKIRCKSFYSVLCYIKRHDRYLYANNNNKVNRLDHVFKEIHKQKHNKCK